MGLINPNVPDAQMVGRSKVQIERDKANADDLARQMLFYGGSTYNGSKEAIAQLAISAGKPLPPTSHEPGVKPGTEED